MEKYEIEIQGPNQKIEIGQVIRDNSDIVFRKDFKHDRPGNAKINIKMEKDDHDDEEEDD